jgi:hypothetical protein
MSTQGKELINGAIKSYTGAIVAQFERGTVTGTTITFKHKFVEAPEVLLTPLAATGTPTCSMVSKDKTGDFWTGVTLRSSGCDSIDWHATGLGIEA